YCHTPTPYCVSLALLPWICRARKKRRRRLRRDAPLEMLSNKAKEGRPTTTTTTGGSCWKCSKPFWPTCLKLIKISGTSWLDPEIVFKLACEVLEKSVVYNKKIELK
ncbi:unnamed protein product, partial [Musa acuminata var. zebrina]